MKIHSLKDVESRLAAYGFPNGKMSFRSMTYGFLTGLVLLSTVASGASSDSSNSASADANQTQVVQQPSTKTQHAAQNSSDVDGDVANSASEKSKANAPGEDWATKLVDYCSSLPIDNLKNLKDDTTEDLNNAKINCLSQAYKIALDSSDSLNQIKDKVDKLCPEVNIKDIEASASPHEIDFLTCQESLIAGFKDTDYVASLLSNKPTAKQLTMLCQETDASSLFIIGNLSKDGEVKCNTAMSKVMRLVKQSNSANASLVSIPGNQAAASSANQSRDKDESAESGFKWWQYLLTFLALAAILLLTYLLIRHLNSLNDSNHDLHNRNQALRKLADDQKNELIQLSAKTSHLEQQLREKDAMLKEAYQGNKNSLQDLEPVIFEDAEPVEVAPPPELEASDFGQLSATLTKWITSNRGNTQFESLLSAELADKLKPRHYKTLLWSDSDGVNSIKPTDSTRHTSVISFTTPDNQGYAFCYKQPNAMASQWQTGAWYQVEVEGSQLKCLGAMG